MEVLIAGGSGFLGTSLARDLRQAGHQVRVLTRLPAVSPDQVHWDGSPAGDWAGLIDQTEAVINLTGYSLAHWPWTKSRKQRFYDSRVLPGQALTAAIQKARRRPRLFFQASGINRYGLRGDIADESTPAADDFLANLTVPWEASTAELEGLGVRRIILRQAVVLAGDGGMLPWMSLPVRLFAGGPVGNGRQAVPWIHIRDYAAAVLFLLENQEARGPFNLVAPTPTSNAEFMRALARALHRPYWLPAPVFLLKLFLGEMSVLLTEGRYCKPGRLLDLGYRFHHPGIGEALENLYGTPGDKS